MSYWANLFPGRRPYLVVREPKGHIRYLGNDELDHGFNGSFGSLPNKRLSIKNIDAFVSSVLRLQASSSVVLAADEKQTYEWKIGFVAVYWRVACPHVTVSPRCFRASPVGFGIWETSEQIGFRRQESINCPPWPLRRPSLLRRRRSVSLGVLKCFFKPC